MMSDLRLRQENEGDEAIVTEEIDEKGPAAYIKLALKLAKKLRTIA